MMYSFGFPRMLGTASSNLVQDKEAIKSNLYLILKSYRNTLFGDPYFGNELRKWVYERSTSIVPDLVIDELYTLITTFIPQLYLTRKDIKLSTDGTNIYTDISFVYRLDNTSDLYKINLTNTESF